MSRRRGLLFERLKLGRGTRQIFSKRVIRFLVGSRSKLLFERLKWGRGTRQIVSTHVIRHT